MTTPLWRQMFNSWEQAVAPGLEQMTASPGFNDILALSAQLNARLVNDLEDASRRWLHLWNLPAATDVRKLRHEVAGLERELAAVRRALESAGGSPAGDTEASRPDLDLVAPVDDRAAS